MVIENKYETFLSEETFGNVVRDVARLNGFKDFLIFDDSEFKIKNYSDCK